MDKLIEMLASGDHQLQTLAATAILLTWTPEECLERLPLYGFGMNRLRETHPERFRNTLPTLKTLSKQNHIWIKDPIGIACLHGFIQCRELQYFKKATLSRYEKTYVREDTQDVGV